ncbi:signal peptidase II [Sphingomonas cavernae]|uniref:Lipoprotein signal peptidase n=1 Tax=Sphingomonas cavernae TaxID=2320861 RepID=A0A418W6T7_9SPHN|nr:signal peptidase II [Sphingomonas cavernae]RJF85667.1 signal peptidase II [Sphingomonas cavernae]
MTEALRNHRRLGLILAACVFALDQIAKYIVTVPLQLETVGQIRILPIFNLTWVENYGVSMGFLRADSEAMRWGLVAITLAISVGVTVWMWREKSRWDVLALGLVLGGALGNIVDRVRFGHVVDFADLHFGDFRPFLVFNVADAAITIGVLVLLFRALFVGEDGSKAKDATETVDA